MLRLACRLGVKAESLPTYPCPAAFSGAQLFSPSLKPIGAFRPRLKTTPSAKGTGLKSSLTLFLLFMARQAPAP